MKIYLVGYKPKVFFQKKHTNFWPWAYLTRTLRELGYHAYHANPSAIDHSKPNVYICWYEPHSLDLIEKYDLHKDSIILQKLTDMDNRVESKVLNKFSHIYAQEDNEIFLKDWPFFPYQKLDVLAKTGYRFYAFGAKTRSRNFPMKENIINKFADRIFWIPWGSMTVPYDTLVKSRPIISNFKYDVAFVGSIWGNDFFGNKASYANYIEPLIENSSTPFLAGAGTERGVISIQKHIDALKKSKLCPIVHSNLWQTLEGVQDRFWTIFSLGRFGVCDNEGLYEFFDEKEVVVEKNPGEYLEKSKFYQNNIESQRPYIESVLGRIQKEYNQRYVWDNILRKMLKE